MPALSDSLLADITEGYLETTLLGLFCAQYLQASLNIFLRSSVFCPIKITPFSRDPDLSVKWINPKIATRFLGFFTPKNTQASLDIFRHKKAHRSAMGLIIR